MQSPMMNPPQAQINVPMIRGRMINDIADITANDVPMDGSQAVFVKFDGSQVYTKCWNSDGTILTRVYVPEIKPNSAEIVEEDTNTLIYPYEELKGELEALKSDVSQIISLLSKRTKNESTKSTTTKPE